MYTVLIPFRTPCATDHGAPGCAGTLLLKLKLPPLLAGSTKVKGGHAGSGSQHQEPLKLHGGVTATLIRIARPIMVLFSLPPWKPEAMRFGFVSQVTHHQVRFFLGNWRWTRVGWFGKLRPRFPRMF
jgi:hypothetical protein